MVEPDTIIDGRYRVISKLGSGGMAEVYLVHDQLLGREVALKLLHRHFAEDQEFVERFRREASSAAGLSHPNIVGIFDRGEWDGTYYIAMEYVAGRSLKSIVREGGALEPNAAIDIVVQILRGARFAHKRGVIHRDLKPHNVILDEEGRARVTDFGIARAGASDMTLTGSIMGTAQYLSPEQAQGYAVDATSDLYSVGVILYELLTGGVPFEGETAVAVAFKQVSAAARPPSELNRALPPSLDAVVMRSLAKDPAARYGNADEFIAALEHERALLPAYAAAGVVDGSRAAPAGAAPLGGSLLMAPVGGYGEDPREPGSERDRRTLWWVLGGLLAAGLIALALLLLLPSNASVTVPDVTGQTQQTADATLRRAGLVPVPTLAHSAAAAAGRVISQTPVAGSAVKKGARVGIVVSSGPANAPLINVEKLTSAQALAKLRTAGYVPTTKLQSSSTVPSGRVIGTEPPAGTEVQMGSPVTVLVSSGPAPVQVPGVAGQSQAAAEAAIARAGLAVGTLTQRTSPQPVGTVIGQAPAAGESVRPGTKVDLTIAQAPKDVAVPDLVGKNEAIAAAALGEAGLKPIIVPVVTAEQAQVGIVLTQHPAAGTRLPRNAAVTLGVGVLGPATTPTTPTTPTTTTPATTPATQSPAPTG